MSLPTGHDSSPTNWRCFFSFKYYLDVYREKSHSWGQNNQGEDFPLEEYQVKAMQNKLKQVQHLEGRIQAFGSLCPTQTLMNEGSTGSHP